MLTFNAQAPTVKNYVIHMNVNSLFKWGLKIENILIFLFFKSFAKLLLIFYNETQFNITMLDLHKIYFKIDLTNYY